MNSRSRILISVVPAMLLPLAASFLYFVLFPQAKAAWAIYAVTKFLMITWPIAAVLLVEKERPNFVNFDWRRHLRAIPLGLATGLAICAFGFFLWYATPVGDYARTHSGAVRAKVEELNLVEHYILFTAGVSILHSLLEEYYWRWFVFGRLIKVLRPAPAYLLASIAFASFHYVVLSRYFPALGTFAFGTLVGVGGLIWCWHLQKQRSLVGCWVSHLLVDAAVFYFGYLLVFSPPAGG